MLKTYCWFLWLKSDNQLSVLAQLFCSLSGCAPSISRFVIGRSRQLLRGSDVRDSRTSVSFYYICFLFTSFANWFSLEMLCSSDVLETLLAFEVAWEFCIVKPNPGTPCRQLYPFYSIRVLLIASRLNLKPALKILSSFPKFIADALSQCPEAYCLIDMTAPMQACINIFVGAL